MGNINACANFCKYFRKKNDSVYAVPNEYVPICGTKVLKSVTVSFEFAEKWLYFDARTAICPRSAI